MVDCHDYSEVDDNIMQSYTVVIPSITSSQQSFFFHVDVKRNFHATMLLPTWNVDFCHTSEGSPSFLNFKTRNSLAKRVRYNMACV
jgi:hypothetical protein